MKRWFFRRNKMGARGSSRSHLMGLDLVFDVVGLFTLTVFVGSCHRRSLACLNIYSPFYSDGSLDFSLYEVVPNMTQCVVIIDLCSRKK